MKIVSLGLAFIFLFLACLGAILPVLPTTPFLLLASFFFAKSSKRFEVWFKSLPLYKKHLESFEKQRAMTLHTKLVILIPVTFMLMAAFFLTPSYIGKTMITLVLIIKYIYFFTAIKTLRLERQ
jgi:uncharacterized membrane protein YbaN (DUF454 family)